MTLDLHDLQGNVVRGYGKRITHGCYTWLDVPAPDTGRRLLSALAGEVTTSDAAPGDSTLNVALSHAGLAALGRPREELESFPSEFAAGMRARARDVLGDRADSDPERWEQIPSHVLMIIQARSDHALRERRARLGDLLAEAGFAPREARDQIAQIHAGREAFGFTDGFGQPAIEGAPAPGERPDEGYRGEGVPLPKGQWRPVRAGEFVLGYEDEDGVEAAAPADPLRRNSTFLVYRKLRQDVAAFKELVRATAQELGTSEGEAQAKIVGRWADGAPLLGAEQPGGDPDRHIRNDFRFDDDSDGRVCPLGAHIRRANPRDALFGGGERTRRHRIVRRGMPYRDSEHEQGLVFVCFNASIARQFEVVQGWLNDGDVFGLGAEHDLIAGSPGPHAPGTMTIQGEPPRYARPPRPLTVTRGGEYLFYPSKTALRALAEA